MSNATPTTQTETAVNLDRTPLPIPRPSARPVPAPASPGDRVDWGFWDGKKLRAAVARVEIDRERIGRTGELAGFWADADQRATWVGADVPVDCVWAWSLERPDGAVVGYGVAAGPGEVKDASANFLDSLNAAVTLQFREDYPRGELHPPGLAPRPYAPRHAAMDSICRWCFGRKVERFQLDPANLEITSSGIELGLGAEQFMRLAVFNYLEYHENRGKGLVIDGDFGALADAAQAAALGASGDDAPRPSAARAK